jgi:hypothetical protein
MPAGDEGAWVLGGAGRRLCRSVQVGEAEEDAGQRRGGCRSRGAMAATSSIGAMEAEHKCVPWCVQMQPLLEIPTVRAAMHTLFTLGTVRFALAKCNTLLESVLRACYVSLSNNSCIIFCIFLEKSVVG